MNYCSARGETTTDAVEHWLEWHKDLMLRRLGLLPEVICRLCNQTIERPEYTPDPHDAHGACIVESRTQT